MTPRADESLLARARRQVPADPDLRECWSFVVRGLELGWLDDSELRERVAPPRRY